MQRGEQGAPETPAQPSGCAWIAYQAFVSGYLIGGVFGALLGGSNFLRARQQGVKSNAVQQIGLPSFRSAFGFAAFLTGYNGGICLLEQIRGKRDAYNAGAAGCGVGFLASLPAYLFPSKSMPMAFKNPRLVVANSLVTGA